MPSFRVIKSEHLFTSKDKKQNGLVGEYFNNSDLKGNPSFTRVDRQVNFAWWDGAPDSSFDPDNYGIRWSGFLVPPKSGKYAMGGYGFNGFRIYIDDSLLVRFDGEFDPVKTYKYLNLIGGKTYKIKIEFYKNLRYSFMQFIWEIPDNNKEQRAIQAAKKADIVLMFMGLSPRLEGEEMKVDVKGFKGGDRLTLNLPDTQENFIKKIYAIGKPIILVLLNGSAVSINWENENLPAIIEAWYPGQSAGTAIADVISGEYNPAGRLPVTFYKSIDQIPPFTDYNMTNRTYRYFKGKPLYPFGYGLSYTKFKYENLKLEKNQITPNDSTVLLVNVTNIGKLAGEEVAQLYIKADKDTVAIKTLKGFQRISLNPGETKNVEFTITSEELSRWIDGVGFSVEPDIYTLMIGSSSSSKDMYKVKLRVDK